MGIYFALQMLNASEFLKEKWCRESFLRIPSGPVPANGGTCSAARLDEIERQLRQGGTAWDDDVPQHVEAATSAGSEQGQGPAKDAVKGKQRRHQEKKAEKSKDVVQVEDAQKQESDNIIVFDAGNQSPWDSAEDSNEDLDT